MLLPGYKLADNELERPEVNGNQKDKEKILVAVKEPGGEKASVLEQIASDRERRKASKAVVGEDPAINKKKRGSEEEL